MSRADDKRAYYERHPGRRNEIRRANYMQTRGGRRSGQEWTTKELERIIAEDRPSDRELAAELGRSAQAIQIKRSRIT